MTLPWSALPMVKHWRKFEDEPITIAHWFLFSLRSLESGYGAWISIARSCFMNMIDYSLREAVVSFCIQTRTAASLSEVLHVPFSTPAGQVTQHYK